MSKPKIYGTCDAGCLWETVHRSDFERSASVVRHYAEEEGVYEGAYILEAGKTYKVKKKTEGEMEWGFALILDISYQKNIDGSVSTISIGVPIELPSTTKFDDFLKIKVSGWRTIDKTRRLVYELDGVKYDYHSDDFDDVYVVENSIEVFGVIHDSPEVYIYNDGGAVELKMELAPPTVSGETLMFNDWRASVSGETLSLS